MFFRLLFLLLLALNVGVAAWLAFAQPPVHRVPATDPGVPELKLLSDRKGPKLAAHKPESAAERARQRCLSIGPFDTQADTRAAVDALSPHVDRIQFRQTQTTESSGWWVYLPAFATREAAITAARTLSDKGVHDYYVITAGDRQNTVSLGLYHDADNARRRRDQIAALGFKPQLTERTETLPQYWVDIAANASTAKAWRGYVNNVGVDGHAIPCF